jgi:outer membrane protein assembly factor BamB
MLQLLLPLVLTSLPLKAEDWPQWRGPNHDGVTSEQSGWNGQTWDLTRKWQADVGTGMGASPIIAQGKVYVMGRFQDKDTLWCLDLSTGKEIWKQQYAARLDGRFRKGESAEGPTCTPSFDPTTGFLYTLGNDGELACWNARDSGKRLWGLNLNDTYNVDARRSTAKTDPERDYGYCGNVLLLKEAAIVEVGDNREGNVMAFDKRSGRRLWASEDRHDAGHSCGPVPMTLDGKSCVVSLTLEGLRVMHADGPLAGRNLAWRPWVMPFNVNCPTPAVAGNVVVLTGTADYKSQKKTTFLEITSQGVARSWEGERQAYICSPVVHQGSVYLVEGKLACMDLMTGKSRWTGGAFTGVAGSIIATGDQKIIVWAGGKLALAESAPNSPEAYKELALIQPFEGGHSAAYPHVALGGGCLIVKNNKGRLLAFAVGAAQTPNNRNARPEDSRASPKP